jgi:hypothetical protein
MRLSNDLSKSFTAASKDNKITAAEAKGLMKASLDEIHSSASPEKKLAAVQERIQSTLGKDHFIQNSTEQKFEDFAKARTVKEADAIYSELASIKGERRKKKTSGTSGSGSAYGGGGSARKPSGSGSAYGGGGSARRTSGSSTRRSTGRSTT